MKKLTLFLVACLSILTFSCKKEDHTNLKDGIYAEIETGKGTIRVALEYKKAPITVANFITLAEGTNPFVLEEYQSKPLYDGLKFHRVISKTNGDQEDFMIQGGDPLGNGSGDAGYQFDDEFSDLKFDKGGYLAMANSGPGTNSCQFFITIKETPWLDQRHTIFGHVIDNGMKVVNAIVQGDEITSIKIIRIGETAKKFDAVKIFSDYYRVTSEKIKKQKELEASKMKKAAANKLAYFAQLKSGAIKLPSGLMYAITEKGTGKKPAKGTKVFINYAGFLENGTLFDTSISKVAEDFGTYNAQRAVQNGYAPIPFEVGTKGAMIPGFEEGLNQLGIGAKAVLFIPSNLAYGENGAGNAIPPNANIIFEIQMLDKP
ncbi:peptidylprolyl isomerase [Flavobacterium aciduliphilum]|uniref:peptidylprolyl isomerase n=1 Tax=Flavobacterium aciduliphilum TaxID=1101402 RepID=A0A328YB56_9FLAO|nr:peptidylprolyl isomerase [Flavobacterium aciduliphilum]RAR70850.1 peptidylprolyl isomerase [Flavobacterium aciduliphilum]